MWKDCPRAAGCCWTTSISWCTCSIPRCATSIRASVCGRTRRSFRSPPHCRAERTDATVHRTSAEGLLVTVRTTLVACLIALAACGRGDDQGQAAATVTASATVPRGPDHLVLRITREEGDARVYAYPGMDTVVWNVSSAPPPARVLAFDDEAGSIAYVDAKGAPARMDFRQGVAFTVTKSKLTGLASWDGSNIYGIAADGSVERYGPSGPWKWKPRMPARAVFPQPD